MRPVGDGLADPERGTLDRSTSRISLRNGVDENEATA
jgi:hypothetical protein